MSLICLPTCRLRICQAITSWKIDQRYRKCSSIPSKSASRIVENSSNQPSDRDTSLSQRKSAINNFWFNPSFDANPEKKTEILKSMLLYTDFISADEESTMMAEIEPYVSRLHYESSHWDDAIHDYRETERSVWNKKNTVIIDRIRSSAFPPEVPQLKLVHILDLAKKGVIKPHIDSIRFCGNTIAGLSLLSDCVMRLRHDVQKEFICDILLPKYSLYIMKDTSRYEFTHEILGESESTFNSENVCRGRRVSIVCRNEPEQEPDGPIFKTTGHLDA